MHGHAAAEVIGFFVLVYYVWDAHPFVGGFAGGVCYVVVLFVLEAQKAADVIHGACIVRTVHYEGLFVVLHGEVFYCIYKIVIGAWDWLGKKRGGHKKAYENICERDSFYKAVCHQCLRVDIL